MKKRRSDTDRYDEEDDFGCMLHAEGLKESIGSMPMKTMNEERIRPHVDA